MAFGPPTEEVRLAVLFWRATRRDNPVVWTTVLIEVAARLALLEPRPALVLTSSRAVQDYGALTKGSTARGFIPKAELSGEASCALLSRHRR